MEAYIGRVVACKQLKHDSQPAHDIAEHSQNLVVGDVLFVKLSGMIPGLNLRGRLSGSLSAAVYGGTASRAELSIVFHLCAALCAMSHDIFLPKYKI